jgi:hypothetical protein
VKDDQSPKTDRRYLVEVKNFENEKKSKIDPQRLLYALRWKHKATPKQLVPTGRQWIGTKPA